jgi:hypothetical protein
MSLVYANSWRLLCLVPDQHISEEPVIIVDLCGVLVSSASLDFSRLFAGDHYQQQFNYLYGLYRTVDSVWDTGDALTAERHQHRMIQKIMPSSHTRSRLAARNILHVTAGNQRINVLLFRHLYTVLATSSLEYRPC